MILEILAISILMLACVFLVATFIIIIKNDVTLNNRVKVIYAIRDYMIDHIDSEQVDYEDMESHDKTLWRVWDWGYKRIIPKEKFELIKPYIKK